MSTLVPFPNRRPLRAAVLDFLATAGPRPDGRAGMGAGTNGGMGAGMGAGVGFAPAVRGPLFEGRSAFVGRPAVVNPTRFAHPRFAFRHHLRHRHFFPALAVIGAGYGAYDYGYECPLRREWIPSEYGWRKAWVRICDAYDYAY